VNDEVIAVEPCTAELEALRARILELEQREESLLTKVIEQQMLLDMNPALVSLKDRDHRYLIVNQAFAEIAGREVEAIVGQTDHDLFPPDEAERRFQSDEAVMVSGQQQLHCEEQIVWADGRPGWVSAYKIPYQGANDETFGLISVSIDISDRKLAEESLRQREAEMRQIVEQQQQLIATIHELSTPVLPIADQTLVMPLIGYIDSSRSLQITEVILAGVQREQASIVIIDITGVPVVDTAVANHIIQTARAVKLLGAQCLLVGISPEVAQTLVQLGIDLSELITRSDLRAGIAYALAQRQRVSAARR
jgi:rsbT co-antagonist protein RsbR